MAHVPRAGEEASREVREVREGGDCFRCWETGGLDSEAPRQKPRKPEIPKTRNPGIRHSFSALRRGMPDVRVSRFRRGPLREGAPGFSRVGEYCGRVEGWKVEGWKVGLGASGVLPPALKRHPPLGGGRELFRKPDFRRSIGAGGAGVSLARSSQSPQRGDCFRCWETGGLEIRRCHSGGPCFRASAICTFAHSPEASRIAGVKLSN